MQILKKNGFTKIRLRRLTLGICTMYLAQKPTEKGLKY
jgi:demethylmenaquinone methyltransferase/2-methoxy-6-polyprenyl-1,4-benzoquinol methylase